MAFDPAPSLRALRALTALGAVPTADQRRDLAGWAGWGPLAPALNPTPNGKWADVADELETILTDHRDWLTAGVEATDTSFYTPAWLTRAMVGILRQVGFTGGRVLEPGCGSGRFMAEDLPGAQWVGVESDHVSAAIAAALHPGATIHAAPLERVSFRERSFDAAIGNVPFSAHAPHDPEVEAYNLHSYFILRALHAVRPGGYVLAVTTRRLFDNGQHTDALLDLAEIRGVARLSSGTFEGTGAVADVLILRRRGGAQATQSAWDDRQARAGGPVVRGSGYYASTHVKDNRLLVRNEAGDAAYGSPVVEVNRHFETYPDRVAGRMLATGYDQSPLRVVSADPERDGLRALASAAADLPPIAAPADTDEAFSDVQLADASGRKEGSFHLAGEDVVQIVDGAAQPVNRPSAELRALIGLRDLAVDLLAADAAPQAMTVAQRTDLRTALRTAYEAYAARFGALNRGTLHEGAIDPETGEPKFSWRRPPMGGFRRDPDYMTVMACEVYDPDTQSAEPAPILLRAVNTAPVPVERVDTPAEALAVCMGERGRVDLPRIGSLLGLADDDQTLTALGDLVYLDPATGQHVSARDYLSGDVRSKLHLARERAERDPALARNVTALEQVLPGDLDPLSIRVTLGSPWIDPEYVRQFAAEVLNVRPTITYTPALALWEVDGKVWGSLDEQLKWGTRHKDAIQLLSAALNGRSVTVWDETYERGKTIKRRNPDETLAAEEKLAAMQDRFGTWVWEDADRAAALTLEFNRRFRSHVPRTADGSGLTFPGIAEGVELWPWQKDAVERVMSSPRTLVAHPVGAGKTREMIATAVTLRRMGLANKPMIAVPGHLLEQIAREATQTFPAARFLVAGRDDLSGNGRRLFAARCATGDWDAVIITHEAFSSIPVDPQAEEDWVAEQKFRLADAIRGDENRSSRGRSAKAIAAAVRKLDARLGELRDQVADPSTVRFEQLGVDFLAVDEVHFFKRLAVTTRAEGLNMGASKRATDLLLKVNVLGARRGDQPHFAGFTGTPWTNSLAETFVWQTFFQPDTLRLAGIDNFDAWAAMFVRYVTAVEVAPDGSGFRLNRRPAQITNVQALMGLFRQVADLLPASAIPLERPDSTRHNVSVEMTDAQAAFVADLVDRAAAIRNGNPAEDNMLAVCGDGRRVALDPHLVGIDEDGAKIAAVASTVAHVYRRDAERTYPGSPTPGSFQLLLCDQGTPGAKGSQTYGRLKAALIARGVPGSAVRFIHEATTDKARAALFAACRDGSVAVLIGSTGKVGVGTNVQARLAALHHVDAPWRPSDIEQREGRGLRPGNLAGHLDIYRYVTQRSFDAYMWQTLETKARFIHALMNADTSIDTLDDIGVQVLTFGEVKALASGNPLLLRHAEAQSQVRRLRTLRSVYLQNVRALERSAETGDREADMLRYQADGARRAAQMLQERPAGLTDEQSVRDHSVRVATLLTSPETWTAKSYQRPRAPWQGLQVEVAPLSIGSGRLELALQYNYREVGTAWITTKALRRDPVRAVHEALTRWVADLGPRIERSEREVDDLKARAAAARQAAQAATFDRQGELDAAESLLSSIERQMQDTAAEEEAERAAA